MRSEGLFVTICLLMGAALVAPTASAAMRPGTIAPEGEGGDTTCIFPDSICVFLCVFIIGNPVFACGPHDCSLGVGVDRLPVAILDSLTQGLAVRRVYAICDGD